MYEAVETAQAKPGFQAIPDYRPLIILSGVVGRPQRLNRFIIQHPRRILRERGMRLLNNGKRMEKLIPRVPQCPGIADRKIIHSRRGVAQADGEEYPRALLHGEQSGG